MAIALSFYLLPSIFLLWAGSWMLKKYRFSNIICLVLERMMEERFYDIEMIYIQNLSQADYSIECVGRRHQNIKLNFSNVEGIEINALKPVEIKQSFAQLSENQPKILNLKFGFPVQLKIKFVGKILIEIL